MTSHSLQSLLTIIIHCDIWKPFFYHFLSLPHIFLTLWHVSKLADFLVNNNNKSVQRTLVVLSYLRQETTNFVKQSKHAIFIVNKCMTQQYQNLRHSKFQDHATCILYCLCSLWLLHAVCPHFLTETDFNTHAWRSLCWTLLWKLLNWYNYSEEQ